MFRPFATSSRYIGRYYNTDLCLILKISYQYILDYWNLICLIFQREKITLTFGFPVPRLLSKSDVSSSFHLAQSYLELFLKQHKCFSVNNKRQKTAITIERDIIAGDVLLWLRGNFYDSFGSIGNGHHLRFFFVKRASELSTIRAGSKRECVELCNFHFCCAFIFCQPMKKFEFLGVSRATRQRHFRTSSTGDENDVVHNIS